MDFFELSKPTYIENWPEALCNLSMAQRALRLTLDETRQFGKRIKDVWDLLDRQQEFEFESSIDRKIIDFAQSAIGEFPNGAFVRLGSRSPKDSMNGMRCTTGEQAFALLVCFSERIIEDVWRCLENDYPVTIFAREWIDIPEWSEFRCFMRGRKLVGISQYHYFSGQFKEVVADHDAIRWAIERWFNVFVTVSHLDDVVFDVFVRCRSTVEGREWIVRLLEINPFGAWTDPCLFDWRDESKFDGSFLYVEKD